MALLKQCFCYSLRQGSFIIGSYSLVVYCVAFAVELWWIVESLLILPAPAYTLCALYFFDFIMAAILLFGLLVRQRKYLMSWTLMTVLSFFPEAGMVLFMSLYYWPAHKFEYGVIELVYWSLRAIFNIFGAVCVCSLYLTWRDEELILGRLHDLTLANVETGSNGVGVLRGGNFSGTLKGNNNLAYQNYAYVDSSPGLPENISYKNHNFHSKSGYLPSSFCTTSTSATIHPPPLLHPSSSISYSSQRQSRRKRKLYCCCDQHGKCFKRGAVGESDTGYNALPKQNFVLPKNNFHSKPDKSIVASLPILWSEGTPAPTFQNTTYSITPNCGNYSHCTNCPCKTQHFGGGSGDIGASGGGARLKYLFCSIDHSCQSIESPSTRAPNVFLGRERTVQELDTFLTHVADQQYDHYHFHQFQQPRSEPILLSTCGCKAVDQAERTAFPGLQSIKHLVKQRQSLYNSSSSDSFTEDPSIGGVIVPKIEIVISTEVHGSIETKVISRPVNFHPHQPQNRSAHRKSKLNIPFNHVRRALSDAPTGIIMEEIYRKHSDLHDTDSVQDDSSANSKSSIIADTSHLRKSKKFGKNGNKRKGGGGGNGAHCDGDGNSVNVDDTSGGIGGKERKRVGVLAYLTNVAKCCVSRSATSLISRSRSGDIGDGGDSFLGGGSLSHRGLYNTRSFTLNSENHQAPLTNHRASLAMKSEFNPALLFDPAYRKSRISELGIAGIGLEPPGQLPIGTFNRMNRSRSLWNVSNEDYWNRPPPSRPVSLGYVNHIHQMDQLAAHKDCCSSMNNNSNATMNLNKQMIMKGGFSQTGYRNPIHGSTTSVATSNHPSAHTPAAMSVGTMGHHDSCGIHRDPDHRRNWLASGRRAQSVDGLNHFYHRYYGRNIAAHHNLHPGGLLTAGDHSQDWSKSSLCPDEHCEDLRNYQDIAL